MREEIQLVLSANKDVRAGYKMAYMEFYLMLTNELNSIYMMQSNCNKGSKLYNEYSHMIERLNKMLYKLNLDLSIK